MNTFEEQVTRITNGLSEAYFAVEAEYWGTDHEDLVRDDMMWMSMMMMARVSKEFGHIDEEAVAEAVMQHCKFLHALSAKMAAAA